MKEKKRIIKLIYSMPFILLFLIMPFVIKMKEYDCGFGNYDWYNSNSYVQDIYSFYRSRFFIFSIIVIGTIGVSGIIHNRRQIYTDFIKCKKINKIWILILLYVFWIIVSTFNSVNINASVWGNYYDFQGVFVQIGYCVICFYTYMALRYFEVEKILYVCAGVMVFEEVIIGYFQMLEQDLLQCSLIQKIILGREYEHYLGGMESPFAENHVSLTFMNPNHAGLFLAMVAGTLILFYVTSKDYVKKIKYGCMFFLVLPPMFFTYSRGAFVAVFLAVLVCRMVGNVQVNKRFKKEGCIGIIVVLLAIVLLVMLDVRNDSKFMGRILDQRSETGLESIVADEEGIHIGYKGENYCVVYDGQEFIEIKQKVLPFDIYSVKNMEEPCVLLLVDEMQYVFIYHNKYYFYYNQNGKVTTLDRIESVYVGGFEHLGSGRIYIWSRVLPIIKEFWMTGSGLNTFPEIFPQDDYVAKYIYCKNPNMIIENPHNIYLGVACSMGLPALVIYCILIFSLLLSNFKTSKEVGKMKLYVKYEMLRKGTLAGTLVYIFGGMFYDMSLYTTPIFWVVVGMNIYYNSVLNKC